MDNMKPPSPEDGAPEPRRVRLSLEPGVAFPVELVVGARQYFVAGDRLGLSEELTADLTAWLTWWQEHVDEDGDAIVSGSDEEWRVFEQRGQDLKQSLQTELGKSFVIE